MNICIIILCCMIIILIMYKLCKDKEFFTDSTILQTCDFDKFFEENYSSWIRNDGTEELKYIRSIQQRTDINEFDIQDLLRELKTYHVQLRLAGLQKLQKSSSQLKGNNSVANSCTFTPQLDKIFTITTNNQCRIVQDGKIFTNRLLKSTKSNGLDVSNTCYIDIPQKRPSNNEVRELIRDVIDILEAVGEKVDNTIIQKINDVKRRIEEARKKHKTLTEEIIPSSQRLVETNQNNFFAANDNYNSLTNQVSNLYFIGNQYDMERMQLEQQ